MEPEAEAHTITSGTCAPCMDAVRPRAMAVDIAVRSATAHGVAIRSRADAIVTITAQASHVDAELAGALAVFAVAASATWLSWRVGILWVVEVSAILAVMGAGSATEEVALTAASTGAKGSWTSSGERNCWEKISIITVATPRVGWWGNRPSDWSRGYPKGY